MNIFAQTAKKVAETLLVGLFVLALLLPGVALADHDDDPFGDVVTFTPSFYRSGEDKGSAELKMIADLSDETNIGNAWFEWGETSSLGKRTSSILIGDDEIFLSHFLSNLDIEDFYYYRAVAQESDGEYVYGDTIRFRIIDGFSESLGSFISNVGTIIDTTSSYPAPTAVTLVPQIVNDNTVIIRGQAETNTSANISAYFRWGTTPDILQQTQVKGLGAGFLGLSFQETLTGLTPGTIYYYRAEVLGPGGRAVGSVLAFTSDGGLVTGFNQPLSVPTVALNTNTSNTNQSSQGTNNTGSAPSQTSGSRTASNNQGSGSDTGGNTNDTSQSSNDTTAQEDTRGFWARLFGFGDNGDENATTTAGTLADVDDARANGQGALILSNGGFFPSTVFGWIILTILIVLLVAIFVYVQTLHEQLKGLREERERNRNGNGLNAIQNS
ncbi:hypothetical protein CL654_00185 [bacterium]|nr:hypothetical protein [bacterium]